MVTNKRKKVVKYRAHTSHGAGHHKKRRGKGSKGGKGRAGSGKRAGHKKYGIVLGSTGFVPRRSVGKLEAVNLGFFTESKLKRLVEEGQAKEQAGVYYLDLKKLGVDKLLSTGNINNQIIFSVASCSQKAREKVVAFGGKIELTAIKTIVSKDK